VRRKSKQVTRTQTHLDCIYQREREREGGREGGRERESPYMRGCTSQS